MCVGGGNYSLKDAVEGLLYSRYSLYPIIEENNVFLLKSTMNSPLWFLTSMFTSILLVEPLFRSKRIANVIIIYLLLSIILSFLPILLPWSIDTATVGALLIYYGRNRITTTYDTKSFVITLFLYVFLVYFERTNNISVREYGTHGFFSVLTYIIEGVLEYNLLVYVLRGIEYSLLSRIFSLLGRMSLMLLCLHAPIYVIIEKEIGRSSYFACSCFCIGICKFVLTFAIVLIIYEVLNKIHSTLFRKIIGL